VHPSPLPAYRRLPRSSRAAAWLVGAALVAHLTAGWVELPVEPAAASTSAVSLVDDRGGAALFTSTGLRPGETETACVALAVTGSALSTSEVTLSAEVTEDALAPYLYLTVERGTLGDPARCASFTGVPAWSGTLAQLPRTAASGIPTGWRPGGPASTTYRVSVTVLDDHRAQGLRAAASFVWALDFEPTPDPTPTPLPPPDPVPTPEPTPEPVPTPETGSKTTAGSRARADADPDAHPDPDAQRRPDADPGAPAGAGPPVRDAGPDPGTGGDRPRRGPAAGHR
jgi:hypothetical protein